MDKATIIDMFAAVFLSGLKDGKLKKTIRNVSLKIFKGIWAAYSGDKDFADVVK
jgi:hypothetical protein